MTMPSASEFKQIVRARMDATGEKYTTALRVVLKAARTAVPRSRVGPLGNLPDLTGVSSGSVASAYRPAVTEDRNQDGGYVLEALADFCEYQAGWHADEDFPFPEDRQKYAAAKYLAACAKGLRSVPPDDSRVLAIGNAWGDKNTSGLMQTVEGDVIDPADFDFTAEELIDFLGMQAIQLLGNPET
jgi:hypothetical protein